MKYLFLAAILLFAVPTISSQEQTGNEPHPQQMPPHENHPTKPSTYDQVDSVRNIMNLDHDLFEKIYSAYDKYNKAVFGDNSRQQSSPAMRQGHHGNGEPRGGMHQGGMRMGPRDRDHRHNDGFYGKKPGPRKDINWEKLEKTKAKQEEKLCKKMLKIFKNDETRYNRWLELRREQLEKMFPPRPTQPKIENK